MPDRVEEGPAEYSQCLAGG